MRVKTLNTKPKPRRTRAIDMKPSKPDQMAFLSANIFWLKCTAQWFIDHPTGSPMYWWRMFLKHLVLFIAYTFPITGEILYLFFHHDDISKLASGLYLMLTELFSPGKLAIFTANKAVIMEIMADLTSDQFQPTEPEHEAIIRAAIRKGRTVAFAYSGICVAAVSAALAIPMMDHFAVLPTMVYYPHVDVLSSPTYEILYFMDVLYKPLGVIIYCAVETLPPVLMASAVAQLEILAFNLEHLELLAQRRLRRLGVGAPAPAHLRHARDALLRGCIQHHYYILEFVRKIEAAYAMQTGAQFMLSALTICLIGLQFFSIDDLLHKPMILLWMFTYTNAMVLEVFMICYFGNEVILKSQHLTTASYNGPWTELDEELKRSLIIFRERCSKPMSVRAAHLFDISLSTFTGLLRWSYNAFAVMNTMQ